MRRYKFRAWHPKINKMIDFQIKSYDLMTFDPKPKIIDYGNGYTTIDPTSIKRPKLYLNAGLVEGSFESCRPVMQCIDIEDSELVIMQYLGEDCKDCEGTELCEDDLVQFRDEETISRIIFQKGQVLIKDLGFTYCPFDYENYKIIGNIYQNPELWKENQ